MCDDCKASQSLVENNKSADQTYRMSHQMKEYLDHVTNQHGFHTRMAVPCSKCGETADLGFVHIVAKEDIEQHKDFSKFRTYRSIREGGTAAYRRTSQRSSVGVELGEVQTSQRTEKETRVQTPTLTEKLKHFLEQRDSFSLYIWPPDSQ